MRKLKVARSHICSDSRTDYRWKQVSGDVRRVSSNEISDRNNHTQTLPSIMMIMDGVR